jgi:putative transposase
MTKTTSIDPKLIDQLLETYKTPEDLTGEHGILKQITKALVERALEAEMTNHLGHDKHERVQNDTSNIRNGSSDKTILRTPLRGVNPLPQGCGR